MWDLLLQICEICYNSGITFFVFVWTNPILFTSLACVFAICRLTTPLWWYWMFSISNETRLYQALLLKFPSRTKEKFLAASKRNNFPETISQPIIYADDFDYMIECIEFNRAEYDHNILIIYALLVSIISGPVMYLFIILSTIKRKTLHSIDSSIDKVKLDA